MNTSEQPTTPPITNPAPLSTIDDPLVKALTKRMTIIALLVTLGGFLSLFISHRQLALDIQQMRCTCSPHQVSAQAGNISINQDGPNQADKLVREVLQYQGKLPASSMTTSTKPSDPLPPQGTK